jgi:hypothetical protein
MRGPQKQGQSTLLSLWGFTTMDENGRSRGVASIAFVLPRNE